MRKKIFILVPLLFFIFFALVAPVYGECVYQKDKTKNGTQNQEKIQSRKLVMAANDNSSQSQNQNKLQNCELVQTKIASRINRLERIRERHLYDHNQIIERLNSLIAKWKLDGYDTSKIEKDIKTWQEKMNEFSTQSQEVIQNLYNVRYLACQSESQFRGELKQARIKLQAVMRLTLEIRNYYRNEIREDILDLKTQKLPS